MLKQNKRINTLLLKSVCKNKLETSRVRRRVISCLRQGSYGQIEIHVHFSLLRIYVSQDGEETLNPLDVKLFKRLVI